MIQNTTTIDVATLRPYHANARRGNVAAIADSLKVSGQYRAIVVNRGTHTGREFEVLAGNHTAEAARILGWESLLAHVVDVDEDAARRIVLADNRTNDLADYDTATLVDLLTEQGELSGTGFEPGDLETLLAALNRHDSEDLDALEDEFGEPQDGDLWVTFTLRLPPSLKGRLEDAIAAADGANDAERVQSLLARVR